MRILLCLSVLLSYTTVNSQSYSVVSTYPLHQSYFNPAALNWDSDLNISLLSRKQWVGFTGSPFTTFLSAGGYMPKVKAAAGMVTSFYSIGFSRESRIELQLAKRFVTENLNIQIGVSPSFVSLTYENPQWITINPVQPDPSIPASSRDAGISLSAGVGVWNNSFFAFAGSQHITEPVLGDINFSYRRSYSLSLGYNMPVGSGAMIIPSLFLEADHYSAQVQADLRVLARNIIAGVGYRHNDAIIVSGGYQGKKIRAGYAYDITTSRLRNFSSGSHELFFSWFIPQKK